MTKARTDPRGSAEAAAISVGVVGGAIVGSQLIASSAGLRLGLTIRNSPTLWFWANSGTRGSVTAGRLLKAKSTYKYAAISAWFANPWATQRYLLSGDYKRAALSHFGPLGSVYVYNRMQKKPTKAVQDDSPSKPAKSEKKKTKVKRRTTRKSAKSPTWCKRHKRYDRCK